MADLGWLTTYDSRLMLAQAIEKAVADHDLSEAAQDKMVRDAASISHHLMILRYRSPVSREIARQGVDEALRIINIGLLFASNGDLDRASNLIAKNELLQFFRIGNTLMNRLKREAAALLDDDTLMPPRKAELLREDVGLIDAEPVPIYSIAETVFLKKISEGLLAVEETDSGTRFHLNRAKPFTTMDDVRTAQKVLRDLSLKAKYVRNLPVKGFFTTRFFLDIFRDYVLAATRHLMANILLKGKPVYPLTSDEAQKFVEELRSPENRKALLHWIVQKMADHGCSEDEVKFARRYWAKAMSNIRSFGKGGG